MTPFIQTVKNQFFIAKPYLSYLNGRVISKLSDYR